MLLFACIGLYICFLYQEIRCLVAENNDVPFFEKRFPSLYFVCIAIILFYVPKLLDGC